MSFANLEKRFLANVQKLYAASNAKFDNGKLTNSPNTAQPYVVQDLRKGYKPISSRIIRANNVTSVVTGFEDTGTIGYFKIGEDRSLPTTSVQQDLKRLKTFLLSPKGLKFLAKQQLLQTGNTFEITRLVNPVFVIGNAVPFLHIKRNLRPLTELAGKTDTSYNNVRKLGQLQKSTYTSVSGKWIKPLYFTDAKYKEAASVGFFRTLGSRVTNFGRSLLSPLENTFSALQAKRNIGEEFGNWNENSWKGSRPELRNDSKVKSVVPEVQQYLKGYVDRYYTDIIADVPNAEPSSVPFVKYFDTTAIKKATSAGRFYPDSVIAKRKTESLPDAPLPAEGKISYVTDPLNRVPTNTNYGKNPYVLKPYDVLHQVNTISNASVNRKTTQTDPTVEDIIDVSFAMGRNRPIRFRAFLKDLNEAVQPQYKSYQYIGRIDKFITYTGVQRDISFKLNVIAFSEEELDIVWTRINYLTAMAFPYGFNQGIFQPNIIRISIGDVYFNQPAYITSLSTVFNEISETWEIMRGKQVPIAATMNMKFTLIEKNSKWAEKPLYGITEQLTDQFSSPPPAASTSERQPPDRPEDEGTTTPEQEAERQSPAAQENTQTQTGNTTTTTRPTTNRRTTTSTNRRPADARGPIRPRTNRAPGLPNPDIIRGAPPTAVPNTRRLPPWLTGR